MKLSNQKNSNQQTVLLMAAPLVAFGCFAVYHHQRIKQIPPSDPLIASVDDTLIHQSDLSVLSPPTPADQALGLLVDFKLLDNEARKKRIQVTDAEIQQQRRNVMGNENAASYSAAAKDLDRSATGLDLQLRHSLLLEKLSALRLKPDPKGMYHARGILVSDKGKHASGGGQALAYAKQLQKQVAGGADIAALAKQSSDDDLSAATGGDLGIIQLSGAPNRVKFAPDFKLQLALAKAVPTAQTGDFLNGPVHGDQGYWVVEAVSTDSKPGPDRARYQKVVDDWRYSWISKYEPAVMAELRSKAAIQPPLKNP